VFGEVQIAPSLLSADFLNLERDVRLIEQAQPDWLHVDVMDGHFVPNLTLGPPVIAALRRVTDLPLDVHLMISNPAEQLDWFLAAGANLITIHVETGNGFLDGNTEVGEMGAGAGESDAICSSPRIERVSDPTMLITLINHIRAAGAQAGISLNPETPVSAVEPFVGLVDLILLMSVHPGFGGQSFIETSVEKITRLAAFARSIGANPLLEVDGGINAHTAPLVAAQGADVLVAGNAIFGAPDPCAALRQIREAAQR
jgi:ribulose-phosphate 3-epimerase